MKRFRMRIFDYEGGGMENYIEYHTDSGKDLLNIWKLKIDYYEGNEYAVTDGLDIIVEGIMDQNDIDIITSYLEEVEQHPKGQLTLEEAIGVIKQEQTTNALDLLSRPDCHCKESPEAYAVAIAAMTILKDVYGMGSATQFSQGLLKEMEKGDATQK